MKLKKIISVIIFIILMINVSGREADEEGLVAYFSFDTNANDESENSYNLAVAEGSPTIQSSNCNLNDCVYYDGNDCHNNAALSTYLEGFDIGTVCYNIHHFDSADAGVSWSMGDFSGTTEFMVMQQTGVGTGQVSNYINNGGTLDWQQLGEMYSGGVDFFCITQDTTSVKMYIDSIDVTSLSATIDVTTWWNDLSPNVDQFALGCLPYSNNWQFNGNVYIDEVSVWNVTISQELMEAIENCNPTTTTCLVSSSINISTNLVNNTNSTDNPFNFNVNSTVTNTNDIGNISFFVNGSLNILLQDINISLNHNLNFSNGNGAYLFNITINNNETISSITRNVFIDTVDIDITENVLVNNTIFEKGFDNLVIQTEFNDSHLEKINSTIYKLNNTGSRVQEMNQTIVTGIIVPLYIFNFTDDLSSVNWELGNYEYVANGLDGHTDEELKYNPNVNSISNELSYGGLKFYCLKTKEMNFVKEFDKVIAEINFTTPAKKQTCYYETTGEFTKVKRLDSKLSLWYVDYINHLWIDEKYKNIEIDLINPQKLKIVYMFDKNTDYFKSESFGDLNFNEKSWFFSIDKFTSYFGKDINISDTVISSVVETLISNTSFNLSDTQTLVFKTSFNTEKISGGATNLLFGSVDLNGVELISQDLRTITGIGDVGVTGFEIINFTRINGNYNLEIYLGRTGNGNILIDNIDATLLEIETTNNENVCLPLIINDSVSHSDIGFTQLQNYSVNNNYETEYLIQNKKTITSVTGTDTVSYQWLDLNDGETSSVAQRFVAGVGDTGSLLNVFIDEGIEINRTFSLLGSTDLGETISCVNSVFGFCLRTENNTKINHFTEVNIVDNTYPVGENLLLSDSIIIKNGSALLIEGSISVSSTTGSQTPNFFINTSTCISEKDRFLSSASDIGNIFFTVICNDIARNDNVTVTLYADVEVGETIEILNNSMVLTAFEITELDTSSDNIVPIIILLDDIDANLTNGVDATLSVQGFDVNGDNINIIVNWTVNGVLKFQDNTTIVSGGTYISTFSSGFYITGQIVNARISGNDGVLDSNVLDASNRTVLELLTTEQLILINISNQIAESNEINQNNLEAIEMIGIAILFIVSLVIFIFSHNVMLDFFNMLIQIGLILRFNEIGIGVFMYVSIALTVMTVIKIYTSEETISTE